MCEGLNLILLQCLVNLQKGFNTFFFIYSCAGVWEKRTGRRCLKWSKKSLQESILEVFEEENANLNGEVKNAKSLSEGISLVQKYENLFKGANKKIINIVGKQGELLKRFKEEDESFDCVGLSWTNIYFKMWLFKSVCKFPVLKNSTPTPNYFKSNLKQIKKCAKQTRTYLVNKYLFHYLLYLFIFVWIILSSLENFIHRKFYSWKILSSADNFIQYR